MKMAGPAGHPKPRVFVSYSVRDSKLAEEFRRSLGRQFDVRPRPSLRKLKSKATTLGGAYEYVGNEIRQSDFVILLLPRKTFLSYGMAYEAGLANAIGKEIFALAPYRNWEAHEILLGLSRANMFSSTKALVSGLKENTVARERLGRPAPRVHRRNRTRRAHRRKRARKAGFGRRSKTSGSRR